MTVSAATTSNFAASRARFAFLAMTTALAAFCAAIAISAAGATGLSGAGYPADRIALVVNSPDDDYRISGGLTVKEKTYPGCGSGALTTAQDAPDLFAFLGGKGDRLAASPCRLNATAVQDR